MPTLAKNKKVFHDYEILDEYEGGLVLFGQEVKSAKNGNVQLKGSFLHVEGGELWLKSAYIAKYGKAGPQPDYDPYRKRKVLVHKRQLERLVVKSQSKGLTMVPISVYTRRGLVKLKFGLAKGKKEYQKKEKLKKRDMEREMQRKMRDFNQS